MRITERDPRERKIPLLLSNQAGVVTLKAGAIISCSRESISSLKVSIRGHMTFYAMDEEGLYPSILRAMAECAEYQDAAAELASEAIS